MALRTRPPQWVSQFQQTKKRTCLYIYPDTYGQTHSQYKCIGSNLLADRTEIRVNTSFVAAYNSRSAHIKTHCFDFAKSGHRTFRIRFQIFTRAVWIFCTDSLTSQYHRVIFHKRATKYRSILREMTYKDKGSYGSSPPCTQQSWSRKKNSTVTMRDLLPAP